MFCSAVWANEEPEDVEDKVVEENAKSSWIANQEAYDEIMKVCREFSAYEMCNGFSCDVENAVQLKSLAENMKKCFKNKKEYDANAKKKEEEEKAKKEAEDKAKQESEKQSKEEAEERGKKAIQDKADAEEKKNIENQLLNEKKKTETMLEEAENGLKDELKTKMGVRGATAMMVNVKELKAAKEVENEEQAKKELLDKVSAGQAVLGGAAAMVDVNAVKNVLESARKNKEEEDAKKQAETVQANFQRQMKAQEELIKKQEADKAVANASFETAMRAKAGAIAVVSDAEKQRIVDEKIAGDKKLADDIKGEKEGKSKKKTNDKVKKSKDIKEKDVKKGKAPEVSKKRGVASVTLSL